MIILNRKGKEVEKPAELGKAIQQLIEDNLDLKMWGFHLSHQDFKKFSYQRVIYNSPYSRFYVSFSRDRSPEYDKLSIAYGRLHAPDNLDSIIWQGEECYCWHSQYNYLRFLDGFTPQQAIERDKMSKYFPDVLEDFYNSPVGKKIRDGYPPKYALAKQAVIWDFYGQRLFDLFDLRQPELWEKYRKFLKEYYQLTGEKSHYGPPYENVC